MRTDILRRPVRQASGSVQKIHNRLEELFLCVNVNPVTSLRQSCDLGLRKHLADQQCVIIFNVIRAAAADE